MILSLCCDNDSLAVDEIMSRYDSVHEEIEGHADWIGCTRLDETPLVIVTSEHGDLPDITKYDIVLGPRQTHPEAIYITSFEEAERLLRLKR